MSSAEPVNRFAATASANRAKLADTVTELRTRLNPDTLFEEAFESVSAQGQRLVGKTRDTVAAHPVAIGAAVAAIGIAIFARNTLANATLDLGDASADYSDYDDDFGAPSEPSASPVFARAQASIAGNPIFAVILGLAAGAVLGLLTPKK